MSVLMCYIGGYQIKYENIYLTTFYTFSHLKRPFNILYIYYKCLFVLL